MAPLVCLHASIGLAESANELPTARAQPLSEFLHIELVLLKQGDLGFRTASLDSRAHEQPARLYAIAAVDAKRTESLLKPRIVLQAMRDNPGKTITVTKVDRMVHDDLSHMAYGIDDVALHFRARRERRTS